MSGLDFVAAMNRLVTDPGVDAGELAGIRAGLLELAASPRVCLHPAAVTGYRRQRGGWRRVRAGRGWRLVRGRGVGVFVMRCPDCPAVEYRLDVGLAAAPVLAPWLVAVEEQR